MFNIKLFIFSLKADHALGTLQSIPIAARRLAMVAGTIPVFNAKTGLPLSSSPVSFPPYTIGDVLFLASLTLLQYY